MWNCSTLHVIRKILRRPLDPMIRNANLAYFSKTLMFGETWVGMFLPPLAHSLTYWVTRSLANLLSHLLTNLLRHSLTDSLSCWVTHSLTHSVNDQNWKSTPVIPTGTWHDFWTGSAWLWAPQMLWCVLSVCIYLANAFWTRSIDHVLNCQGVY